MKRLLLSALALTACGGAARQADDAAMATAPSTTQTSDAKPALVPELAPAVPSTAEPSKADAKTEAPKAQPADDADTKDTPAKGANDVPGANLTAGSISADGLTLEDLECKLDAPGFMSTLVLVGMLSKKAKALSACAPNGDRPRASWTSAGGRLSGVRVKGASPAIERCVAGVLKTVQAPLAGACAATIVLPRAGR